jgi:2-dehydropantoate 2-reductase
VSTQKIKIGFLGAGSIGSLFGGYLASIQSTTYLADITFFCNKKHAEMINKTGLMLHKNGEILKIDTIKAYDKLKRFEGEILDTTEFDFTYLFLTTKTYDIEAALRQYKKLIDKCKKLVILQNGIGNEDIIGQYCSKNKIIRIITTNGALFEEPGHVIHTGKGITKIGYPFKNSLNLNLKEVKWAENDLKLLADLLNHAGLETIIVDDIIKECWEKIFVNIGINAFGALTRLKNGILLELEGLRYFMSEAINEAIKVAKAKKINLFKKDFILLTYEVARETAENKNSMLQDILKGKKTEIDFINGRIVNYAKKLGVNTPVNELLTNLIKGLEKSLI